MEYEQPDYHLAYINPPPKKKKVKVTNPKTLFSLWYGKQLIEYNKPFAVCKAKVNELKRNNNYKSFEFKIC